MFEFKNNNFLKRKIKWTKKCDKTFKSNYRFGILKLNYAQIRAPLCVAKLRISNFIVILRASFHSPKCDHLINTLVSIHIPRRLFNV